MKRIVNRLSDSVHACQMKIVQFSSSVGSSGFHLQITAAKGGPKERKKEKETNRGVLL